MIYIAPTCIKFVKVKSDLDGFCDDSLSAVAVYPNVMKKKKFPNKSQYRNDKSEGYVKKYWQITADVYCISEYIAIMLNKEKFVTNPALHSFISSTIEEMFVTFDVNGAEIEAYVWESDSPASDCFKAPQSLAPSPHIETILPKPC